MGIIDDPDLVRSRKDFADLLTWYRQRAGLTVRDVAKPTRLPASTLGGYFSGRHLPPLSQPAIVPDVLRACGITDDKVIQACHDALLRVSRTPGPRPASAPVPYRGLSCFQPEDSDWFYGREELTELVLQRLWKLASEGSGGALIVVGPSGSGKSSLLRAGVIAALERHNGSTEVMLLTPGDDPLAQLSAVQDAAAREAGLVAVIDQFEELFACDSEAQRQFVAGLAHLCGREQGPVVVIGLRADFFDAVLRFDWLTEAIQHSQVVVGPMNADELRRAIVEPARLAKVDIEDGLVEILLRDATPSAGETGPLPLLSHALLSTWERGKRTALTVTDYLASGGVQNAVAQAAEDIYTQLTDTEQATARRMFLRLVNVAREGADTRRRMRRDEIALDDNPVLDRFVTARLVTADFDSVVISHEAVLHAWPRLRGWVDADRAGIATRQQIIEAARAWAADHRDPAALLTGSRLAAAREWAAGDPDSDLTPTARDFLQASLKRQRRNLHRLYQTISTLVVLLLLAVAGGVLAVRATAAATDERNRAVSRLVATSADRLRDKDVALAAQLSLAAYRIWPTAEARAALLDSSAAFTATRMLGSAGVMQSVALSPDRRTLAAGTADRTIILWDVSNPRHPTRINPSLTGPRDVVYSVVFSPDGKTLAAGTGDSKIYLFDLSDPNHPEAAATLTGPRDVVYSVAFSPNGKTLAAGSADGLIHRWDVNSSHRGIPKPPISAGRGYVQAVTFSPSGRLLASGGEDKLVRLWRLDDAATPTLLGEPMSGPTQTIFSVAFSPDETMLAAGSRDSQAYVWQIDAPKNPPTALTGGAGWVNAIAFSPSGTTIAASMAGEMWLWDWRRQRIVARLPHPDTVTSIVFGDDDQTIITAAADGVARRWWLPGPALATDDILVNSVRFHPSGDLIAVSGGETRLLSMATRDWVGPAMTNPSNRSTATAFTPDGTYLMVGDSAGQIHVWNVENPAQPDGITPAVPAHERLVESIAIVPSGEVMASASDDTKIRLWDIRNPHQITQLSEITDFDKYVYWVAFSPDGKLLAAASIDNSVRLWDISNPAHPLPMTEPIISSEHYALTVAFSPDSRTLAIGSADKSIYLWDISQPNRPARLHQLVGPAGWIYAIAFNADGSALASANTDGTIWLWNVAGPKPPSVLAALHSGQGRMYTIAFHPSGRSLAAAGGGKTLWLWILDPAQVGASVCDTTGDALTSREWHQYVPDMPQIKLCPDT